MNLMRAMWKAAGVIIFIGVLLHLLADFPLAVLTFGLWLVMAALPGMNDGTESRRRAGEDGEAHRG